ncbi:MAG: hypothetical protein KHX03_06550 [Clostridium sp.]|nr:hypothetical protein [Clostridium sp.]
MDFSKGVLFDPGYSKYTLAFATNIDAVYNVIFSMKAMHQRKFKFQTVYPQILKLIEHTVGFYLGCLLWASYISQKFDKEPKEILENDYLGKAVNEDEMLFEVNYAISYLDKLKKDCKYYLGKNCNIPDDWYQVMNVYKEFLVSNNFLVNTKNTSELKLPPELKKLSDNDLENILSGIESVLKTGEFKELFKLKPLILS